MEPDPWTSRRLVPLALESPAGVARLAMRTRDPAPAEALARAVTGGLLGDHDLLDQVLDGGPERWTGPRRSRRALLFLASVWAVVPGAPERIAGAAAAFEHLWDTGERRSFRAEHHILAGQTLLLAGMRDSLTRLLPDLRLPDPVAHALRTDLVNPWSSLSGGRGDDTAWSTLFGRPFTHDGLAVPVVGDLPEELPFDRLTAPGPRPGSAGGALVTVVMPCYRPDRGLLASVRSIVGQTYGDLEVLLVDDASGPGFEDVFEEATGLDPRVRRVTLDRNGGSYLAREAAIGQARGDLVTFQDADDWSHPSRIEHQVEVLGGRPGVGRSLALRAHDDLSLQWLGYSPIRRNASSLLLHRSVLERCGGFVPIRKGADSELTERVEHLDGPIADTGTVLAITRLRTGSLSRADFTYSWMAPDRVAFRSAFRAWHRALSPEDAVPGRFTTEALHALPFDVPRTFLRGLPGLARIPVAYRTAFLADLSRDDGPASRWLHDEGLTGVAGPVGLWHQESPTGAGIGRPVLSDAWSDRIQQDPRLHGLSRVAEVEVDRVLVLDPEVLALTTTQECRVRATTVELCLTPTLTDPDASLLPADLLGLAERARSWLGATPAWVPAPWLTAQEVEEVRQAVPGLLDAVTRR